jgi:serine/threonine protein kinase
LTSIFITFLIKLPLAPQIIDARYPPLPPSYSPELRLLCDVLLAPNPAERPSAAAILSRPIIRAWARDTLGDLCPPPESDASTGAAAAPLAMKPGVAFVVADVPAEQPVDQSYVLLFEHFIGTG